MRRLHGSRGVSAAVGREEGAARRGKLQATTRACTRSSRRNRRDFSLTPNDSRTPPPATCLRLTIIIQLYRVTCKHERDASSSCRLISLFSRFDLSEETSGRLADEHFVHSEILSRIDASAERTREMKDEKEKKTPLPFNTGKN